MGWHGDAFTVGSAVGAPLAGLAIDHSGWQGAFVLTSLIALAMAVVGLIARARWSTPDASAESGSGSEAVAA